MKPIECDVYFTYQCPGCEAMYQATVEETRFPGGVLCVACGAKVKFDPIEKVIVKPVYKKSVKPSTPRPSTTKVDNRVITALAGLGYSKTEAKKYATQYAGMTVKEVLKRVTND